jgi:hypothetical protein
MPGTARFCYAPRRKSAGFGCVRCATLTAGLAEQGQNGHLSLRSGVGTRLPPQETNDIVRLSIVDAIGGLRRKQQ